MNTTIVPDQQDRTRDLGSVEQHTTARPTFLAECVRQLHDLERWFGSEALAAALDRYTLDRGFQARRRAARPGETAQAAADAIRMLRSSRHPESEALANTIAAGMATPQPTAAPYPGAALLAQPTSPATTAAHAA